jgi:hypothetical protein
MMSFVMVFAPPMGELGRGCGILCRAPVNRHSAGEQRRFASHGEGTIPTLDFGDRRLASAFNLAGAVGILSIFAPSGLGVRESVQLLLLPLVMPAEVGLVVTIAARLWSIAVDVAFYAITRVGTGAVPTPESATGP